MLLNHLRVLRAGKNISQGELAKMVNVSRQTISLIERGNYSPSVTLALNLAEVFECRVEDIFELGEDEESEK